MTNCHILDSCLQKTILWIRGLQESRNIETDEEALAALHAVLHSLRDRLTVEDGALLAAQLPLVVRGIFYENWEPVAMPVPANVAAFERQVQQKLDNLNSGVKAGVAIPLVFHLLDRHVTPGVLRRIKGKLPVEMNEFWPQLQAA